MKTSHSDLSLFLRKDIKNNIACIGFFLNYPVVDYYIKNDSAIIFGKSDHLWAHISSSSTNDLAKLLEEHHNRTNYYFSVEDWMVPLIQKHGKAEWIMTTNRYILNENSEIDSPTEKITSLDISHTNYIYENSEYQKYTSPEYIKDRLTKDISAGIWLDNKLVAWGFTHDDGAIGFLHVLSNFRKKGYAIDIIKYLIIERRKMGKAVFVNIVPDNIPAINLVGKLGFSFDRKTSWLKLKE